MSSVSIANKILNLNKPPPEKHKKGRSNRMTNSIGELQLMQPNHQMNQPLFEGMKENPMFIQNPGFSPLQKEDNNFAYYRQNENINTIKIKNKKPYDGAPVKGGERTTASEVLDEFRLKYLDEREGKSLLPQNGMKPQQQQKYFSKFSPQPSPTTSKPTQSKFSFISHDFEDPSIMKPTERPVQSPVIEDAPQRNKDFNVDEVLNDYRNKRNKKGGGDKPIPTQKNEDVATLERIRNEQLNAKMSGYVFTPTYKANDAVNPRDHIYQSLKHIPTEVQDFYKGEPKQNAYIKESKEFNAWNAYRPGKPEKYVSKQSNGFHFGLLDNDDNEKPQPHVNPKVAKPVVSTDLIPDNDISNAALEMFPDSDDEATKKQDFSINQVLNDYKSKHKYKVEDKKQVGKHEAVIMKEQLTEQNRRNMEKEKQRMKRLGDTTKPVKREVIQTSSQLPLPRPMDLDLDVESWVATSKRHSQQPVQETLAHSENRESMDVENWEAPSQNKRYSSAPINATLISPAKDKNIVSMEYSHPVKEELVSSRVQDVISYEKRAQNNQLLTAQPERQRAGSYRDDDGWTRASAPDKVNPGPTTQALDYFKQNRSPNVQRSKSEDVKFTETIVNTYQENDANKTASSRSNPNVTFTQKDGKDLINEFKEYGDPIAVDDTTRRTNQNSSIYNYNGGNREVKSKSEPNLYMSKEKRKNLKSTDLNQLNFTKMSSNLRRSRMSNSTDVYDASRKVSTSSNFIVINNRDGPVNRGQSSRSRSTLGSGKNSITSFGSSVYSNKAFERNVTTVTLAKNWSGRIVSSNQETEQSYDYGVDIPQTKNINGLVFRNKKPIEHVEPTDRSGEAMNSLKSLDKHLKTENDTKSITTAYPIQWMGKSPATSPRTTQNNAHFYRESKQPINDMGKLCEQIKQSGLKEGQLMRVEFYEFLHKMTTVVNEIIQALPKDLFPFKITPCSFQGDFENKGLHKIDLYLNIEDLKEYQHQVNFLMKRDLAGYVILKCANREKLKSFCAKNRDSGDWVLSATRLMVVFSYLINTKLRSQFEHDSAHRRKKIAFDAKIKFDQVSEHEVRLNISFPNNTQVFNVGLVLALNVTDFPNVIDMNKERTWPLNETKSQFVKHGVHLIAKPGIRNHGWGISFLKTRKILLSICDQNQTATNILLALQVVNKTGLSNRDCDGLLLPSHFIMVLFWMYEKHQDQLLWNKENMGRRFLDIIIGMKRCLEQKICPDFFFPPMNYFQNLITEKREHLLQNVNDILNNPESFLGLREHRVSSSNLNR